MSFTENSDFITLNNGYGPITYNIGSATTASTGYTMTWTADGQTAVLGAPPSAKKKSGDRLPVSPKIYFQFLKSKFQKDHLENLKARLHVLKEEMENAFDVGQFGLGEHLSVEILKLIETQELAAMGITQWLPRKTVEKYIHLVGDGEIKHDKRIIKFGKLENFPRPIKPEIREKIKAVHQAGVFAEMWVLYLDYSTQEETKSTAEKVRNKDPILFGVKKHDPDKLYYVIDWVDEVCDLTLEKIMDQKVVDMAPAETMHEIDQTLIEQLKVDIEEREQALRDTNSSTWRDKFKKEKERQAKKVKAAEPPKQKAGLISRIFRRGKK